MADSANKDVVSNNEQTDDVASSKTPDFGKPDDQISSAEAQDMAKQKLFDQMVKANAELTAKAKINADLLITFKKEVASHALDAKLAREQTEDLINGTYTGGEVIRTPWW